MNTVIKNMMIMLFIIPVFSCQFDKKRSQQNKNDLYNSVDSTYSSLTDSLNHAWDVMIADDDEKLQFMKRLLQEVSYTGSFDEKKFEKLLNKVKKLKEIRYDKKLTMTSEQIDRYDSATNVVTQEVIDFAYGHPQFNQKELMQELVDDIYDKNSMILIYRVHYDAFAEQRNALINEHKEILDSGDYNLEPLPLFKIPPEEI